jgi:hypothetical protein
MKSYAKTLPGSVWAVDRRRDETPVTTVPGVEASAEGRERRPELRLAEGA